MLQKKICMLGSFAVGKTSLVARYVRGEFSEKYLTTVGVKIDRKELVIDEQPLNLMVWDIHGDDEFQRVRASYLRGVSGYFLIADGTRPATLDAAIRLHEMTVSHVAAPPFILLLNKADLALDWTIEADRIRALIDQGWYVHKTSAKLNEHVEASFEQLARQILTQGT